MRAGALAGMSIQTWRRTHRDATKRSLQAIRDCPWFVPGADPISWVVKQVPASDEVSHLGVGDGAREHPEAAIGVDVRDALLPERVADAVKDGEEILVMFSGIGPLPICIAKKHRHVRATAVELNPVAHNYCVENIHLNKVADRVKAIRGDVREVSKNIDTTYDRILMPLPKGAYKFLDVAVPLLRDRAILHFYHWAPDEDPFTEAERLVAKAVKSQKRRAEFIRRVKVSQYSPRFWKVRVDARIFSV